MMQPFVSPNLFNAHALPTDNDEPHAQLGNHLRVSTNPALGLPVAPFLVWRAHFAPISRLNRRTAAVFHDMDDQPLFPPFEVTPDRPAVSRIVLGQGEVCLWAQVNAEPRKDDRVPPGRPDRGVRRGSVPDTGNEPDRGGSGPQPRGAEPNLPLTAASEAILVCEAYIDSARGPASIGTRSEARYAFSGPGIVEMQIRGNGTVHGINWIESRDKQPIRFQPYAVLNLPTENGARYLSITDPIATAANRVDRQAPKRTPLQDTTNAPAPVSAPLHSITEERERVESLLPTLFGDLDSLINDLSTPPLEQRIKDPIIDENGTEVGSSSMARLHRVMQAQADPGTATFLGYKTYDDDWPEVEERLVFYQVEGFFRDFSNHVGGIRSISEILFDALVAGVRSTSRDWDRIQLARYIQEALDQLPPGRMQVLGVERMQDVSDYFAVGTTAIADRGAPLDPVPAPAITSVTHRTWLPEVPPAAKREVFVDCADVRVAGLLAAGKRTPTSGPGTYSPLNKANDKGYHLPLVLSLNVDDETAAPISEPGTGFIADREAAADSIRYFLSQQDRFGRFSNWAARNILPGVRPKPPRPELQAFYSQPSINDAQTEGGDIRVKVMVPDREALAPGSHLIATLRLHIQDQTLGTTATVDVPESDKTTLAGDPNTFYLLLDREGPVLQRTEVRKLRLTARWIDTAGVQSAVSEPQTLTMYDPRPPEQLTVPDLLQYSARPDVTGLAWVEHRWTPEPGQESFGVFYTDENRLQVWLESQNENGILGDLDNAADAAARATIYRTNVESFPDHLFERLRDVLVDMASGEKAFRHAVSGSLRLLNFYKIAAEASSGARPILTELPMIVYGVPNSDPPAQPTVEVFPTTSGDADNQPGTCSKAQPTDLDDPVVPVIPETQLVACVKISLLVGATVSETWRLRRSAVESSTIAKMPVVATGSMSAIDADSGRQEAKYRDHGPVVISPAARLKPWVRYSWVAEVQGAPESGSAAAGKPMSGRWSRASNPVSAILIPQTPPPTLEVDQVTGTVVSGGRTDVWVTLSHPDTLDGGSVGTFRIRVSRRPASGEPLRLLNEVEVEGNGPHKISGHSPDDSGEVVVVGSEYVVKLIDPVGRTSPSVTAVVS